MAEAKDFVEVEGEKVRLSVITLMQSRMATWLGGCCGFAGLVGEEWRPVQQSPNGTVPHMVSFRGLTDVTTKEFALAIRIAAYRSGSYRSGYVLCSSGGHLIYSASAKTQVDKALEEGGFKPLDKFVNPAHGSNAVMTIYGAPTIQV